MQRRIIPDIIPERQTLSVLAPSATVRQAAAIMAARRIGAIMVAEDDRLVGIFSERDMVGRVVARGLDPDQTRLDSVMTREPFTIGPDDTASSALDTMQTEGFRHLPVLDGRRIVGMVSIRDLYAAVKVQLEQEVEQRNAYIFGGDYGVGA